MSTHGTYCEIEKTGGYMVRLSLEEYKGKHRADLRQGVSIPIQEIPELVAGLSKLHKAAQASGILAGGGNE